MCSKIVSGKTMLQHTEYQDQQIETTLAAWAVKYPEMIARTLINASRHNMTIEIPNLQGLRKPGKSRGGNAFLIISTPRTLPPGQDRSPAAFAADFRSRDYRESELRRAANARGLSMTELASTMHVTYSGMRSWARDRSERLCKRRAVSKRSDRIEHFLRSN